MRRCPFNNCPSRWRHFCHVSDRLVVALIDVRACCNRMSEMLSLQYDPNFCCWYYSPTGSTAYSMAAGGSVVHPAVPSILVTPICPHVLSFRSMIFPDHVVLRCYVPEDARSPASVAFDGKHRQELQRGDSIQIQMSNYPVPTVNRGDHSSDWLESLKRSFNFNTRPRQRPL